VGLLSARTRVRAVLLLLVPVALMLFAASPVHAAGLRFGPLPHSDARDAAGGPLDITRVTFGQQDTRIVLSLRTAESWSASDLVAATGRELCLELFAGEPSTARARICVAARGGRTAVLRYIGLDSAGKPTAAHTLAAGVRRPDRRTLEARLTPAAINLPLGHFSWRVVSRWTDPAACAAPDACLDTLPNRGTVNDEIVLLAAPPCFGAASRDPLRSCSNPALRRAVVPTPNTAKRAGNAYCAIIRRVNLLSLCAFGVTPSQASTTVAVIGDSHAQHWRGALEVVAQAKRWRGLSITRSGCPFTRARPILPTDLRTRQCSRWNGQLRVWFRRHPEVTTVFVAAHAGAKYDRPPAAGYRSAWRGLPKSVRRVFVLRDTPSIGRQGRCVQRAIASGRLAGQACSRSRSRSLRRDPLVAAARGMSSARVPVIDMTRYFCSARRCQSVIGGALVHKDGAHLTRMFAATLGPFVLRAVDAAG